MLPCDLCFELHMKETERVLSRGLLETTDLCLQLFAMNTFSPPALLQHKAAVIFSAKLEEIITTL